MRDDRPHAGTAAPAVWFRYSPDRKGIRPQTHLKDFHGTLQADAYAGYNAIYSMGRVIEAGCWAHARRRFHDIHVDRPTLITTHVLDQIAHLYRIEAGIRGSPPEHRRQVRQEQAAPIVTALHAWLTEQLSTLSRKSAMADAISYAMNQWQTLTRYLDDGALEIDNSVAERSVRGIACDRKNYLFLGSDRGGERAATMYSLMETAKLNGIDPEPYGQGPGYRCSKADTSGTSKTPGRRAAPLGAGTGNEQCHKVKMPAHAGCQDAFCGRSPWSRLSASISSLAPCESGAPFRVTSS